MKARLPDEYRGGGQAAMMKQLQKMQEDVAKAQEEVENSTFSASVGGGAVTAEVDGKHQVRSIKIQPEVVDPEDVEMLEDLITAALNEALSKADEAMEQGMQRAQGGLPDLGGLSGLL
ncbi:MAG: YbaB/EbfC family nucleoid-associated protein [Oscillospiraceae bacterium]|jgi:DNA-binding YbaB/EbfC family protein|nr:YbaB/EbfC family nucleoid-associated protein [Oscillospiraceae bacterium]